MTLIVFCEKLKNFVSFDDGTVAIALNITCASQEIRIPCAWIMRFFQSLFCDLQTHLLMN